MNIGDIFKLIKDKRLNISTVSVAIHLALCLVVLAGHALYANTPICKTTDPDNYGWSREEGSTCVVQASAKRKYIEVISSSAPGSIQAFEGTDVDPFDNSAVQHFDFTAIESFKNATKPYEDTAIEPFENTSVVAFRNTIYAFEDTAVEPFKNTAVQPFEDTAIESFEDTIYSLQ